MDGVRSGERVICERDNGESVACEARFAADSGRLILIPVDGQDLIVDGEGGVRIVAEEESAA